MSLVHIMKQVNPVDALPSYFFKIHYNIVVSSIPGLSKRFISFTFSNQNPLYIFFSPKHAKFPPHLMFPNMIGVIIFGDRRYYVNII
jgi:hypothetical protein